MPHAPSDLHPARSSAAVNFVSIFPFVLLHLGCLAALFVAPTWEAILLGAFLYLVRMFGITAGYHRYFAHRTYKTSRIVQFLLALIGCCALQRGPIWWSAQHRRHHRHADTSTDPHSPLSRSAWYAQVGWLFAAGARDTDWATVRDWSRFPELRWMGRVHLLPGMLLGLACWLIAGPSGLAWGFFVSTIVLYHCVFSVNSICHLFGTRRYPTPDGSRNNLWVALLTLGEGWHNNHHQFQGSARQGVVWWEVDISYYLIRIMERLGLVWGVRSRPNRSAAA